MPRPTATRVVASLVLATAWIAVGCSDPESDRFSATAPVLAAQGERDFIRYCASCHGRDGRGAGPAASALRDQPPDLTQIAARRDGVFSSSEIRHHVDGRFSHPSHGTREMPIWGERFGEGMTETESSDEVVRGRVYALVDYLQSIQDPPPSKVE